MSRFRRLIHSVLSGYANLAVTIVYSLASIPLALHYLTSERFGLWALMSTVGAYLTLVDFGMSGSVARLLIDHKDDQGGGNYGSLIKTGACVTLCQGLIAASAGFVLAPILAGLLKIPPNLQADFITLLRLQVAGLGFSFASKIFSHVLTAHQRMEITNYSAIAGLIVNFAVQWFLFRAGYGVFSLAWGVIGGVFINALICLAACFQFNLFPRSGTWGRVSWNYFQELFAYGKDLFLVSLGTQLIMASQTMIITRRLGLEAAAAWAVGTRAFTMVCQLIWRIIGFSMPAFSEMIVREERERLYTRFKDISVLSASCAGFCAITFAISNASFVHILSHKKIAWEMQNDVLLGIWMILLSVVSCHSNLVLATKRINTMRYIYFLEGAAFIVSAWITARWGGFSAIVASSIVCTSVFSFSYGIRRSSQYFAIPIREILIQWLTPMYRVMCLFGPIAVLLCLLTQSLSDPVRLCILFCVSGTAGVAILFSQGLPGALKGELLSRVPKPVGGIIKRVFNYG
jgi:O-antigen/teichoic acid export membrane protein